MLKKKKPTKKSLFDLLGYLKDHRRKQGQRHSLPIVLTIIIMAVMSGAKGERAVARFTKNNNKELIRQLKIKRKEVPSRSVISGLIQNIDFKKLENIFYKWSTQFINIERGEWLNLDGKAIRGTVTNANNAMQNFVSLVTVFVNKKQQVLTVGRINTKKENEIPTVKQLIKMLDLQGVTFTLDALHCQEKTVKTIISTKNNYLIGVKGNQKTLSERIKKTA